jgi:hypothetical protein
MAVSTGGIRFRALTGEPNRLTKGLVVTKRRNTILALGLILVVLFGLAASKDYLYGLISYDPDTGIMTVNKPTTFTGSASIGTPRVEKTTTVS